MAPSSGVVLNVHHNPDGEAGSASRGEQARRTGNEPAKEVFELAAGMKVRRRRGGGGSRLRRLLAHQLMLSERWGSPFPDYCFVTR